MLSQKYFKIEQYNQWHVAKITFQTLLYLLDLLIKSPQNKSLEEYIEFSFQQEGISLKGKRFPSIPPSEFCRNNSSCSTCEWGRFMGQCNMVGSEINKLMELFHLGKYRECIEECRHILKTINKVLEIM
ncbi:MAG: hypothetical protein ACTSXP_09285 [Promethearchaeota archaeon]